MFNGLRNEIAELNRGINDAANSEKAKKLRKKLLCIGIPIAILGFGGMITCFALFVLSNVGVFERSSTGPSPLMIVSFILFAPLGFVGGIGMMITHLGLSIAITGYTASLMNDALTQRCPECGDPISVNELFCTKCGHKLRNQCSKCGFINEPEDKFCAKCGNEL